MQPQYLVEYTSVIASSGHYYIQKRLFQDMYIYEHICIGFMHNPRCSEFEDTHSIGWVSVLASRLDVNAHTHVAIRFRDSVRDPEFDK